MKRPVRAVHLAVFGLACAAAGASGQVTAAGTGYAAPRVSGSTDTLRSKAAAATANVRLDRGAAIPGYLSSWGLPPVPGSFWVTDSGFVFLSTTGHVSARAATVSLAYMQDENGRPHYLFRTESGVFETDAPGRLLDVATGPDRQGGPASARGAEGPAHRSELAAPLKTAREIGRSAYADSLYDLFGQPRAPVGLIGRRGQAAGRLGEYIASRDSLALDPGRMTGEPQLRHALAHELGHRWQSRAKAQLAALWQGVPAIRDPRRYGFGDLSEHQAEAIAFAINFLQTTAASEVTRGDALALLEHYELLVPGTRTLTRYLLLQPLYRNHPLRSRLTASRVTYALEK